ncbi:Uncharacterised protein [uncultured Clostridium sp.]|uniref:hypothetical protein n=1 Tax=uncultured Clostridium sp. TaxID=59620 RepID=UPI000821F8BC|nr:hypothetical protein [uncultured Clostridium sp.]SCJ59681.1 Uncharacterised protein [uncultured Clostridium sp.]
MDLTINEINEISAEELLQRAYGKNLDSKKTVLEYIEIVKVLRNPEINGDKAQETYNLIYASIDKMNGKVKPNTVIYLMNALKAQLGKFVSDKDPKKEHEFIKYLKLAYPAKMRGKGFTRVLANINNITDEQIWNTITYINRGYIKREIYLTGEDKIAIKEMVGKLVEKSNIKYVNQVKSMEKLMGALGVKVINVNGKFKIK